MSNIQILIPKAADGSLSLGFTGAWGIGFGPKEYGQYLTNKRGYSHKRTNKK